MSGFLQLRGVFCLFHEICHPMKSQCTPCFSQINKGLSFLLRSPLRVFHHTLAGEQPHPIILGNTHRLCWCHSCSVQLAELPCFWHCPSVGRDTRAHLPFQHRFPLTCRRLFALVVLPPLPIPLFLSPTSPTFLLLRFSSIRLQCNDTSAANQAQQAPSGHREVDLQAGSQIVGHTLSSIIFIYQSSKMFSIAPQPHSGTEVNILFSDRPPVRDEY